MKLKYKKMILIVSMSAMGIGMITLSLSGKNDEKKKEQTVTTTQQVSLEPVVDKEFTVTMIGTPNDGVLRMDAYKAINKLVKDYMMAKASCDYEAFQELVNDPTIIDEEGLRAKAQFIEDYQNISCYTLNGLTTDAFIVYVYEDLKILNVNTLAPGMTRLYIKLDEDKKPYIYLGAVDDATKEYIENTEKNEKVAALIATVNKKMEEAVTKDADLKKFVLEQNDTTDTKEKEDEDKTTDTKKADASKNTNTSKDSKEASTKKSSSKESSSKNK